MRRPSETHAGRIVVGFRDRRSSLAALRWAIGATRVSSVPLRVVHASDAGVAVRNGPSSAVAHQLGSPIWASMYSLVQGLGAPDGTETIVETGNPTDVLLKHITAGDIVVLGKRRRLSIGSDIKQCLESRLECDVIRVGRLGPADTTLAPAHLDHVGA